MKTRISVDKHILSALRDIAFELADMNRLRRFELGLDDEQGGDDELGSANAETGSREASPEAKK